MQPSAGGFNPHQNDIKTICQQFNVDPKTGMIVNLTVLKKQVKKIVDQFDHKYLNLDTPFFKDKIPTTENIAIVLFELIDKEMSGEYQLVKVRLYERQDLYVDVWK